MRRVLLPLSLLVLLLTSLSVRADSAEQIRHGAGDTLSVLRDTVVGADTLLEAAAGVLVFPDVVKLGFGTGGEYGEGVLLVAGEPAGYYATAGAPFGLPRGSRRKSEVVVFVSAAALEAFLEQRSWRVGPGGLQLAMWPDAQAAVVGLVLSDVAPVPGLTLDGARFTRLAR